MDASVYGLDTHATFDRYDSGLRFDIYDYTPLFYNSPLVNDISDRQDLIGQQIQGYITATTYTIDKPRHEDLIIHIYPPQDGGEIFRVSSFRPIINAINSTPNVNWYELTLEYAPIIDLKRLNYLNHYVYNLVTEKYLFKNDFINMIKDTEKLNNLFKDLKHHFDYDLELYYYNYPILDETIKIYPLYENYLLYEFLSDNNIYKRYFNNAIIPFGIKYYHSHDYCFTIINGVKEMCECPIIDTSFITSIESYNTAINIYNIITLINMWKWN